MKGKAGAIWQRTRSVSLLLAVAASLVGTSSTVVGAAGSRQATRAVTQDAAASSPWTHLSALTWARQDLAVVAGADGRIYAIGGFAAGDVTHPLASVEAYAPGTNSWAVVANMPTPRGALAAAAGPDGRIYAIGGLDGAGTPLRTVEVYSPRTNHWTAAASLPTARGALAAATGPDGRMYAIGGITSGSGHAATVASAVEAYNPRSNTWRSVASLPLAVAHLAAIAGPSGRIYAVGGASASGATGTVQVYLPGSNVWRTVAPLPTARQRLAVALGADKRLWAIDGDTGTGAALATVEAYDPRANTWAPQTAALTARAGAGAAQGPDGRIYVLGGAAADAALAATAEAYGPTLGLQVRQSVHGIALTVAGSGFTPDSAMRITFRLGAAQPHVLRGMVDHGGNLLRTIRLALAPREAHKQITVIAVDQQSRYPATATYVLRPVNSSALARVYSRSHGAHRSKATFLATSGSLALDVAN